MPLLEEMTWEQVKEYLKHDDRLILAIGSTEQHGRHLTFATDAMVPAAIGRRVSEATGIILAPALAYGMSLHHLGFPGSLSLRPQTLVQVLLDILDSAAHHGFRRILLLNGHGGNIASIGVALGDILNRRADLEVRARSWWTLPAVETVTEELFPGVNDSHAGPTETAVFLALRPELAKMDRAAHTPDADTSALLTQTSFPALYPHGVIGDDPRLGSAEAGQKILDAAVKACVAELEAWGRRPGRAE